MARFDNIGLFWEDLPAEKRGGPRQLGPMPSIPETGWTPPREMPDIRNDPWIALDVETYDPELKLAGAGWARNRGHICGISAATPRGKWYFPMRHEVQREMNLDPDMVLRWARYSFGNNQPKIGANILYDIGWLKHEGVTVAGQLYDCQYAEALIKSTSKLSLETLGNKYLKRGKLTDHLKTWAQTYYMSSESDWRKDIYRCPPSLVGHYAEEDALMPYEILMKQWPILSEAGQIDLFHMECDLINLLVDMRFAGVQVDIPYAEKLREDFIAQRNALQAQARGMVGFDVNVAAADSLERAYKQLGLSYGRTATGKPSFTAESLKAEKHPFAGLVRGIRETEKLRGTFIESYLLDSNVNGKVHCTFHAVSGLEGGTRTGRLSSSDPNLQNIPTRTEQGGMIRRAFIMDHGHACVRDYDYSQIEYRMLAHFATGAGSDEVRQRYVDDPALDYHDMIGALIKEKTGIELKRSYVKNINFGLVYGLGIVELCRQLGVDLPRGKQLSEAFHNAVPFARTTMDWITDFIQWYGYVETILGRRNHFDLWEPKDYNERKHMKFPLPYDDALDQWGALIMRAYAYRGTNYKLQGSAAEIMKKGMVDCYKSGVFNETGVPRLTVHDELFFSDPGGVRPEAWAYIKHTMETCIPQVKVPIRFDCGTGSNWKEAH